MAKNNNNHLIAHGSSGSGILDRLVSQLCSVSLMRLQSDASEDCGYLEAWLELDYLPPVAHSRGWQVDAGCWWEAPVLPHIGLFTGLPDWIHDMVADLPQSKWSMLARQAEQCLLWSRLKSYNTHFCHILQVTQNSLFHCQRRLHKHIDTEWKIHWGHHESWLLLMGASAF